MTTLETAFKDSSLVGASWTLSLPEDMNPAESTFTIGNYSEAVFEPDNRTPVDETDYQDGGKYRSVVKLIMRYEGQAKDDRRWAIGTGWLVAPDTLITAGHCVFDRSGDGKGLGRVTHMKTYIGYCGSDSVNRPNSTVQARRAVKTVTTAEWVKIGDRRYDVAFVKVDRPFEGKIRADNGSSLRTFAIQETPVKQRGALLGVVGYPGDKYLNKEKGAQMYELFETVDYDLATSQGNMLQYRISTFKGQSGAPVISKWDAAPDKGQGVVIGTHCYGGDSRNSASVIGGAYGVNYQFFLSALNTLPPTVKDVTNLKREANNSEAGTIDPSKPDTESGMDSDTEGFLDVLKSIGRVVAPVVQTALPFVSPLLGPLGGPVSAIGGVAMGLLNKAVQESDFDSPTPIAPARIKLSPGQAERAVVAESVLQTVLRMERSPLSQRILDKTRTKYAAVGFTKEKAAKLGPKLVPLLSQAGLRVAVQEQILTKPTDFSPAPKPVPIPQTEADLTGDTYADKFLESVAKSEAKVLKSANGSSESFFDNIGPFLAKALKVASPGLLTSARAGLQKLDTILAKKQSTQFSEGFLEDPTNEAAVTDEKAAALLAQRAVIAECALQAVLEADQKQLRESVILGESSGAADTESFFGGLLRTVQKIAPAVIKVAGPVLSTAVPVLLNAVAGGQPAAQPLPGGVASFGARAESLEGGEGEEPAAWSDYTGEKKEKIINGVNGVNGGVHKVPVTTLA
ncbi:trypsin-like cysteine/serine peptidase domain-containing protein [Cladorrhinum sp. PSN259]|nr:trypsin-like cysteine/serine peptidase domain-containing protein [Cladorrhinum sp. PSN259]